MATPAKPGAQATSDEAEVLMQFHQVKLKRPSGSVRGTLTLTMRRLTWSGPDGQSISVGMSNIKKQMVSKAGAKHAVLSLVLIEQQNDDFRFTFPTEDGRDQMKDMIANLSQGAAAAASSQNFKASSAGSADNAVKASGTMAEGAASQKARDAKLNVKYKALKENPELLQTFKDLTDSGLSADEFWEGFEIEGLYGNDSSTTSHEQLGVSSDVISKFKPQKNTGNDEIRFKITPDMIIQIFKFYPELKRAYETKVPAELSEEEFWNMAVHSEMFHRGSELGKGSSTLAANNDITELFGKLRQQSGIASAAGSVLGSAASKNADTNRPGKRRRLVSDPRFDLEATEDRDLDGYGVTSSDQHADGTTAAPPRRTQRSRHVMDVRQLNRDSDGILHNMQAPAPPAGATATREGAASDAYAKMRQAQEHPELMKDGHKTDLLVQALGFDMASVVKANLTAAPKTQEPGSTIAKSPGDTEASAPRVRLTANVPSVKQLSRKCSMAVEQISLKYLRTPETVVPAEHVARVINTYCVAINGILRHFWMCFSPSNKIAVKASSKLGEKAIKMTAALRTSLDDKIPALKERVGAENGALIANLEQRVKLALAFAQDWKTTQDKIARLKALKAKQAMR
eukprot:m.531765 g.531765  ORF g.531765 m.531765 type:complete len:628 (-) comp22040_c0_seq10:53-1936(-)